MQEYKEIHKYEQYKRRSRVIKGKLKRRAGGLKEKDSGRSVGDSCFHYADCK